MDTRKSFWLLSAALVAIGFGTFAYGIASGHPERAWQAYLINFLLWSAIAQGAVLFSALMTTTRARWSGPLSGLSEAFAGFFPVSFILFLVLFFGSSHVFPWSHGQDLHGKEIWLNVPFVFTRNFVGLLLLYGFGFTYLYYAMLQKEISPDGSGPIRSIFNRLQQNRPQDPEKIKKRKGLFGILYLLAFALVLSLIGYDLVMAMDPHWISTLFGAYTFVKAIYIGLGGLIILAAVMHLNPRTDFRLSDSHFHDIGKLFFAFCLVWADFFYVQLVVIWYGNIPEETAYVIERTMMVPWRYLAWVTFAVSFVLPFFILLNRKIKTMPQFMLVICSVVIIGIWLEHLLLIGPPLSHATLQLPLGISDALISLGFLGLMLASLRFAFTQFPELAHAEKREVR
ncbi:MAG: hypothetical protein AMJ54_05585 [Deltaproteobacteria bacterium SG8_13]|nr:MAG: hypothetical protein AMJ54_05585 [Deltaproteobacteria bacterium SG8_13]